MARIRLLDNGIIDKIAAGEVVEKPASVVKELVENALDAGAGAIAVEIRDGGIEYIRVTDNGQGMSQEDLPKAFWRHATSKIRSLEDLEAISSLGFRGEALSSIAAVAKVEVISKTASSLLGSLYRIEGGEEKGLEAVGAPTGTTFLVQNLFFQTPARRKFLKSPGVEGGAIGALMEHLALSRPDIAFSFTMGGRMRFQTPGDGDLAQVIYRIYGREAAQSIWPIEAAQGAYRLKGYLGSPQQCRGSRSLEHFFVNGRYIKSLEMAKAVEEGYKAYMMQHKFPFFVLHLTIDPSLVDVNVHPAKLEVKFAQGADVGAFLTRSVQNRLGEKPWIYASRPDSPADLAKAMREERREWKKQQTLEAKEWGQPFESRTWPAAAKGDEGRPMSTLDPGGLRPKAYFADPQKGGSPLPAQAIDSREPVQTPAQIQTQTAGLYAEMGRIVAAQTREEAVEAFFAETGLPAPEIPARPAPSAIGEARDLPLDPMRQQSLFDRGDTLGADTWQLLGQAFDTYWLVERAGDLLIIDQHAAHEKVYYERFMRDAAQENISIQALEPPLVLPLRLAEERVYLEHKEVFAKLGFAVEEFGDRSICLRGIPQRLYGRPAGELFMEILEDLESGGTPGLESREAKIASMACKAAVKGGQRLSLAEAKALLDQLLSLENPYHCPHGRPVIISMSRRDLDKKFRRIL